MVAQAPSHMTIRRAISVCAPSELGEGHVAAWGRDFCRAYAEAAVRKGPTPGDEARTGKWSSGSSSGSGNGSSADPAPTKGRGCRGSPLPDVPPHPRWKMSPLTGSGTASNADRTAGRSRHREHHFSELNANSSTTPHDRSTQRHSVPPCSIAVAINRSPNASCQLDAGKAASRTSIEISYRTTVGYALCDAV